MPGSEKPRLGVFKFASCDGCQLTLLDCEDELLPIADRVEIADFREASSAVLAGPYDLALVEGSVTTPGDVDRIRSIRANSRVLVTIGACATSGGIQALRNFADVRDYREVVYARPEFIETLATSTPIQDHVKVDFELRGCPINKVQLLEVIRAYLGRRTPNVSTESVCIECKRRGTVCVLVAHGTPCLGPVTQAGCGAICPSFDRGCYGCFGPQDTPNAPAMSRKLIQLGMEPPAVHRIYRTFNANAPAFRAAADAATAPSGAP
ncbi:MAG TPA: oxidoreductase [Thermoplasmata archaeon]|jgi:coenzyme F420-reducing hydrogenase gamma subunit|nr:oxidoreductase [Thermoplasmata archaeon]